MGRHQTETSYLKSVLLWLQEYWTAPRFYPLRTVPQGSRHYPARRTHTALNRRDVIIDLPAFLPPRRSAARRRGGGASISKGERTCEWTLAARLAGTAKTGKHSMNPSGFGYVCGERKGRPRKDDAPFRLCSRHVGPRVLVSEPPMVWHHYLG
jgi:hypothetical protein